MTRDKAPPIVNRILQAVIEKKGFNILVLDVRGVSTFTDYFVIAEANVDRHAQAICRSIIELLKKEGQAPFHVEGDAVGDWIVLDFGEVLVHLFKPGLRDKYTLEELWKEGQIVQHPLLFKEGPSGA